MYVQEGLGEGGMTGFELSMQEIYGVPGFGFL